jgi:hypothetical protein
MQMKITLHARDLNRGISTMTPLLACCAGIYLGLHFTILAVLPVCLLGLGAFFTLMDVSGQNLFDLVLMPLVPVIALQGGYFLGLTARDSYEHLVGRPNVRQSKIV